MDARVDSGSGQYALLDQLAEEFAERYRRGERPSLGEYTDRYPDLADEIRELFPALVEVEQVEGDRRVESTGPTTTPGPAPPQQVGDYRIIREVGRGGMGVVYEAEQISLGRRVALKVLPSSTMQDGSKIERFRREASSAALASMLLGRHTSPTQAALRAERMLRVQEALNRLDPIDREVLALRHFEQLNRAETAQVLDISEEAGAKRYIRALKRLKDVLTKLPGGLEGL